MAFKSNFKKRKPFVNTKGPDYCHVCGTKKIIRLCKCYKVKLDKKGLKYKKYSGFSKTVTCCPKCMKNK